MDSTAPQLLSKLRKESVSVTRLALVMQAARSLDEWANAVDALERQIEKVAALWAEPVDTEPRTYIDPMELLARGQRLQEALHYQCGPAEYDPSYDWRDTV